MADTENDIVLTIDGMSKSFGRNRVLDHISMNVRRGTVMGLMGENGAGKSTMMKCKNTKMSWLLWQEIRESSGSELWPLRDLSEIVAVVLVTQSAQHEPLL